MSEHRAFHWAGRTIDVLVDTLLNSNAWLMNAAKQEGQLGFKDVLEAIPAAKASREEGVQQLLHKELILAGCQPVVEGAQILVQPELGQCLLRVIVTRLRMHTQHALHTAVLVSHVEVHSDGRAALAWSCTWITLDTSRRLKV